MLVDWVMRNNQFALCTGRSCTQCTILVKLIVFQYLLDLFMCDVMD